MTVASYLSTNHELAHKGQSQLGQMGQGAAAEVVDEDVARANVLSESNVAGEEDELHGLDGVELAGARLLQAVHGHPGALGGQLRQRHDVAKGSNRNYEKSAKYFNLLPPLKISKNGLKYDQKTSLEFPIYFKANCLQ